MCHDFGNAGLCIVLFNTILYLCLAPFPNPPRPEKRSTRGYGDTGISQPILQATHPNDEGH